MAKTIINVENKIKYGVCNTSNVRSTRIGHAASVLAELPTGLENGMIVSVGGLATGETDIRTVSAATNGGRVGIISSPEFLQYSQGRKETCSLQDFYIPEGKVGDEYDLAVGDSYEVSDNLITLASGVKLEQVKFLTPNAEMKYDGVTELPAEYKGIVLEVTNIKKAFKNLFYLNKLSNVQYSLVKVYVKSM